MGCLAVRPAAAVRKASKLPIDVRTGRRTDVTDPGGWSPFGLALEKGGAMGLDGIGFVFAPSDPFHGLDLDDCLDGDAGELAAWADGYVREFDTYTEVSPSGRGVKLIGRGKLPGPAGRHDGGVEIYDRARYFTITGRLLPGTPREIRDSSVAALRLYTLLAERRKPANPVPVVVSPPAGDVVERYAPPER